MPVFWEYPHRSRVSYQERSIELGVRASPHSSMSEKGTRFSGLCSRRWIRNITILMSRNSQKSISTNERRNSSTLLLVWVSSSEQSSKVQSALLLYPSKKEPVMRGPGADSHVWETLFTRFVSCPGFSYILHADNSCNRQHPILAKVQVSP